ncbi:ArsR/SmtB family transcription factor [Streptomyces gibsoniae]|uniref:Winged helix-turn-helix domain-containing protein n=1 Tax=Streptomyces gibsoniae TaxID=3075529 RepID=A0ABU2U067_9ACTN|nr:winged helix-turn-helix domain-containing protein [Streptomyces sp. DSM 41699]MDT0466628.1 winged helix-turn-helix domain-containing protein [Streptomyces sp. DSM 41699]
MRIHLTAADMARIRFAPRPAPLQELNAALSMACRRDNDPVLGHWRWRLLHSLPAAVRPLQDLVPAGQAPGFLDVFSDTLHDGLEVVRSWRPELARAELERVYANIPSPSPVPPWVRDLHRGDADAWQILSHAQQAAFETVLRPVWSAVQDLHHAEFTRHAVTVAEHGVGSALTDLVPGSRLHGDIWELDAPGRRDIRPDGRGLLLLPTFHWTGHPLISDLPDHPVALTYPAGPGLPLPLASENALSDVLGRTRLAILLLLDREHTTGDLARRLGVSNATASAHTAALRGASLITTSRAGRAVLHRRTPLGTLLVHRAAN